MESIQIQIVEIVDRFCSGNRSEFARRLNITPAYASQIYSGVRTPSDRTISDICREFRVREEWLRTGNGEMIIEDTHREKLQRFFADVLATAPDERSGFVAALADLPDEFWPLVADLARHYADSCKTEKPE